MTEAPCAAPVDTAQAQLDAVGLESARQDGLPVVIAAQCRGFSVVAHEEMDPAEVSDYINGAEQAYMRLSADSQVTLAPRALVFLFPTEDALEDGLQVLARSPRSQSPHATPPGFAWLNTIWVNAEDFDERSDRLASMAHEFTHLFVGTAAHGKPVPSWLNEGLAVRYQFELPSAEFPEATAAGLARDGQRVAAAARGSGPVPLFHLDEIASGRDWQSNYNDPLRGGLEYAEGHAAVRWLIDRKGVPTLWSVLRAYGDQSQAFESVLRDAYGLGLAEIDAGFRVAAVNLAG
jgi:hypothetical protein